MRDRQVTGKIALRVNVLCIFPTDVYVCWEGGEHCGQTGTLVLRYALCPTAQFLPPLGKGNNLGL